MFSIILQDELKADEKVEYWEGRIYIGDFYETFRSTSFYWNEEAYQESWRYNIEQLSEKNPKTALIVNIEYDRHYFGEWWCLYLKGNTVAIRNGLILNDMIPGSVVLKSTTDLSKFIRAYSTETEEQKISEWCTSLADLKAFIGK